MSGDMFASLINAGSAGAVIAVVLIFLNFVEKRDRESRAFFESIRVSDAERSKAVVEALNQLTLRVVGLEDKFDRHDATEMEFLRGYAVQVAKDRASAAQARKTQPRPGSKDYPGGGSGNV